MDARLVFHSNIEPCPADYEAVSTGMLVVIRVDDFLHLSAKGEWLDIHPGVLVNSEAAGREQELYHVHPSYLQRNGEGGRG